jgi:hypothetical protein
MTRALARRCYSQCSGKTPYASVAEAQAEQRRHGYALYVYKCPGCAGYHLTRQPQRQPRARDAAP